MAQIKLLAIDLDGTLLNNQKKISFLNQMAIKEAQKKGVKIVITTGRPLIGIIHILEALDLKNKENYSITFNGGLVQENTGKRLFHKTLDKKSVEHISKMLLELQLPVDIISGGKSFSLTAGKHQSLYPKFNALLDFHHLEKISDLPQELDYNNVVSVFDADYIDQQIPKIPQSFYREFELFKSKDIMLEIVPKGVNKGSALAILGDYLGIKKEEMMAIGDEENDLSMLRWVGVPVAMKNATNLVKKEIKTVTSRTNNESGVAEAIEKYILREVKDGFI